MHVKQFLGLIPSSFEAVGVDPDTGEEQKGTIKIKLNRLAFKTVTAEGFVEAMKTAESDPNVIGELLAGKTTSDGQTIPGVLAWWEMFSDDEQTEMLPITVENIISLPYDFVMSLSEAVMKRLFPEPARAASSPAGLVPEAKSHSEAPTNTTETP